MTSRQLTAFAFLAFAWGGAFLYTRVLVTHGLTPVGVSFGRTALGLVALLPLAWRLRHTFPRDRPTWVKLAALGALNFAIPWTLLSLGTSHVPSGVATISNTSTALWAALLTAVLVPSDRLSGPRLAGLMAGFAGVAILVQDRVHGLDRESLLGIPPMLLATFCYALSAISIRRWMSHVPALALTVGQVGWAAVYLAPAAIATNAFAGIDFGWREWGSLLALGFFGSGFGVVVYMALIHDMGAVRASVVTYLMPPIGVVLGWLLLDEAIGWPVLGGSALILGGVAVVQFGSPVRLLRRGQPAAAPSPPGG